MPSPAEPGRTPRRCDRGTAEASSRCAGRSADVRVAMLALTAHAPSGDAWTRASRCGLEPGGCRPSASTGSQFVRAGRDGRWGTRARAGSGRSSRRTRASAGSLRPGVRRAAAREQVLAGRLRRPRGLLRDTGWAEAVGSPLGVGVGEVRHAVRAHAAREGHGPRLPVDEPAAAGEDEPACSPAVVVPSCADVTRRRAAACGHEQQTGPASAERGASERDGEDSRSR